MMIRFAISTCLAAALLCTHAACARSGGSRSGGASKPIVKFPVVNSSKPKTVVTRSDRAIVVQRGKERTVILRPDDDDAPAN